MKITLLILSIVLSGCNSMTYESGSTKFSRSAVGTRNSITELLVEVDPATGVRKIHMKGYRNDQVEALGVVAEGVAKGVAQGLLQRGRTVIGAEKTP